MIFFLSEPKWHGITSPSLCKPDNIFLSVCIHSHTLPTKNSLHCKISAVNTEYGIRNNRIHSRITEYVTFNYQKWKCFELSNVELTSILVPSYRLRVTVLLSSGCRATVESLSSVHSSSTVTDLPCWMLIARAVSAEFKAFSFPVIKVIPLFRYSVITYSTFYSIPKLVA